VGHRSVWKLRIHGWVSSLLQTEENQKRKERKK